jgi:DNA-directed RNA polymerase specialized sigma24 family protein
MPENFSSNHSPEAFDEFHARFYPKLVEWLVYRGMPRAEAEEAAQEICLAIYMAWSRITDPDGWGYNRARWRLTDRARRLAVLREQPLVTTDVAGREVGIEPPSEDPDIALVLDARERMVRHWDQFLGLFETRSGGYRKVVRALTALARKRAPEDRVNQFVEAHQLVFTGTGEDKRDSDDVSDLAKKLRMTTGALLTALSRLQPVWYECALETYLKGVYCAI